MLTWSALNSLTLLLVSSIECESIAHNFKYPLEDLIFGNLILIGLITVASPWSLDIQNLELGTSVDVLRELNTNKPTKAHLYKVCNHVLWGCTKS